MEPVHIWQQTYYSYVFHVVLMFWLTLGRIFALFFDAFVDFEYSLFIVNVIKCYHMAYLCGTPSIYESSCKTLVYSCANDYPYGVFFRDICL